MRHKYNTKGELVSEHKPGLWSVTTILDVAHKPALQAWRDNVGAEEADRYMRERADIGTATHGWIEGLLNKTLIWANPMPDTGNPAQPLVEGFVRWLEKFEPTTVATELFVYSKRHGYAGSADYICKIDGELWIIDFKTSKSLHDSMGLQLAAYRQAYEEMTGKRARTAILKLTTKTQKGWQFKEYNEPIKPFLGLKAFFDWEIKKNPPKEQVEKVKWDGGVIR